MLGHLPHNAICDYVNDSWQLQALVFTQDAIANIVINPMLADVITFNQIVTGEIYNFNPTSTLEFVQSAVVSSPVFAEVSQSISFSQVFYESLKQPNKDLAHNLTFISQAVSNIKYSLTAHTLTIVQTHTHNQKYGVASHQLFFAQTLAIIYPKIFEVLQTLTLIQGIKWSPRFEELSQQLQIFQATLKTGSHYKDLCNCIRFSQKLQKITELAASNTLTFVNFLQNSQSDHHLTFTQLAEANVVDVDCCNPEGRIGEKTTDGSSIVFSQTVGLTRVINLPITQTLSFKNTTVFFN